MFEETQLLDDLSDPLPTDIEAANSKSNGRATSPSATVRSPTSAPPTSSTLSSSRGAATGIALSLTSTSATARPLVPGAVLSLRQALAGRDALPTAVPSSSRAPTEEGRPRPRAYDSTMPLGILPSDAMAVDLLNEADDCDDPSEVPTGRATEVLVSSSPARPPPPSLSFARRLALEAEEEEEEEESQLLRDGETEGDNEDDPASSALVLPPSVPATPLSTEGAAVESPSFAVVGLLPPAGGDREAKHLPLVRPAVADVLESTLRVQDLSPDVHNMILSLRPLGDPQPQGECRDAPASAAAAILMHGVLLTTSAEQLEEEESMKEYSQQQQRADEVEVPVDVELPHRLPPTVQPAGCLPATLDDGIPMTFKEQQEHVHEQEEDLPEGGGAEAVAPPFLQPAVVTTSVAETEEKVIVAPSSKLPTTTVEHEEQEVHSDDEDILISHAAAAGGTKVSSPSAASAASKAAAVTKKHPMTNNKTFEVGQDVEAKWGANWYAATVVAVLGKKFVEVRWAKDRSTVHVETRHVRNLSSSPPSKGASSSLTSSPIPAPAPSSSSSTHKTTTATKALLTSHTATQVVHMMEEDAAVEEELSKERSTTTHSGKRKRAPSAEVGPTVSLQKKPRVERTLKLDLEEQNSDVASSLLEEVEEDDPTQQQQQQKVPRRRSRSRDLIPEAQPPTTTAGSTQNSHPHQSSSTLQHATPNRMVYVSDRAHKELVAAQRAAGNAAHAAVTSESTLFSKIASWSGSAVVRSLLELLALVNTSAMEVVVVVSSRLPDLRVDKGGVLHNSDLLASLIAFAIGVSPFGSGLLESIVCSPAPLMSTTSQLESHVLTGNDIPQVVRSLSPPRRVLRAEDPQYSALAVSKPDEALRRQVPRTMPVPSSERFFAGRRVLLMHRDVLVELLVEAAGGEVIAWEAVKKLPTLEQQRASLATIQFVYVVPGRQVILPESLDPATSQLDLPWLFREIVNHFEANLCTRPASTGNPLTGSTPTFVHGGGQEGSAARRDGKMEERCSTTASPAEDAREGNLEHEERPTAAAEGGGGVHGLVTSWRQRRNQLQIEIPANDTPVVVLPPAPPSPQRKNREQGAKMISRAPPPPPLRLEDRASPVTPRAEGDEPYPLPHRHPQQQAVSPQSLLLSSAIAVGDDYYFTLPSSSSSYRHPSASTTNNAAARSHGQEGIAEEEERDRDESNEEDDDGEDEIAIGQVVAVHEEDGTVSMQLYRIQHVALRRPRGATGAPTSRLSTVVLTGEVLRVAVTALDMQTPLYIIEPHLQQHLYLLAPSSQAHTPPPPPPAPTAAAGSSLMFGSPIPPTSATMPHPYQKQQGTAAKGQTSLPQPGVPVQSYTLERAGCPDMILTIGARVTSRLPVWYHHQSLLPRRRLSSGSNKNNEDDNNDEEEGTSPRLVEGTIRTMQWEGTAQQQQHTFVVVIALSNGEGGPGGETVVVTPDLILAVH